MKLINVIILFSITIGFPTPAKADCIYNGTPYPTGTEVSGLVCQPDGTWQPKQ
ncbi:hypothetical protein GLO73106DRAFT_00000070 [Gloeocapsa sp. PCC 73106]|nr:hypothetical protein GLO73106DRAFT_00000070 [Gloeocapsa sp. PCC 73106]